MSLPGGGAWVGDHGLLDGAITTEPFTVADAIEAARLRPVSSWVFLLVSPRVGKRLAVRGDLFLAEPFHQPG